ncbi:MAG: YggT family protein [Reinekea sp.]|jgi:YggT family protein
MSLIAMILNTIFGIVLVSLVARFLAQMARADFYNPLAQTVIKITDPFIKPMRKIIPSIAGMDTASLIAILLGQLLLACLIVLLSRHNPIHFISELIVWSFIAVCSLILSVIKWSMIIVAISSFILMGQHNPFVHFIAQMIEPFVGPFRRLNLQIGMLDLSFMVAFFVIYIIQDYILLGFVGQYTGYQPGIFFGG